MKRLLPTLLCLLCTYLIADAQRFKAGVVVGINAAQLDGDDQMGYTKLGISSGLRGEAIISKRLQLGMELLFSQRGAKPSRKTRGPEAITIRLNYAEIPVLANIWIGKPIDKQENYRFQFQTGIAFARLLNLSIDEPPLGALKEGQLLLNDLAPDFNKKDWSFILGLHYYFNQNTALGIRHNISLSKLYNSAEFPDRINKSLRSYFLNLQLIAVI